MTQGLTRCDVIRREIAVAGAAEAPAALPRPWRLRAQSTKVPCNPVLTGGQRNASENSESESEPLFRRPRERCSV